MENDCWFSFQFSQPDKIHTPIHQIQRMPHTYPDIKMYKCDNTKVLVPQERTDMCVIATKMKYFLCFWCELWHNSCDFFFISLFIWNMHVLHVRIITIVSRFIFISLKYFSSKIRLLAFNQIKLNFRFSCFGEKNRKKTHPIFK